VVRGKRDRAADVHRVRVYIMCICSYINMNIYIYDYTYEYIYVYINGRREGEPQKSAGGCVLACTARRRRGAVSALAPAHGVRV